MEPQVDHYLKQGKVSRRRHKAWAQDCVQNEEMIKNQCCKGVSNSATEVGGRGQSKIISTKVNINTLTARNPQKWTKKDVSLQDSRGDAILVMYGSDVAANANIWGRTYSFATLRPSNDLGRDRDARTEEHLFAPLS